MRSDCGAQPILADTLNLKTLHPDEKHAVDCDKYISPVDMH